jgi:hypothetical protein
MSYEEVVRATDNGRIAVFHIPTWRIYMYDPVSDTVHYKNMEV